MTTFNPIGSTPGTTGEATEPAPGPLAPPSHEEAALFKKALEGQPEKQVTERKEDFGRGRPESDRPSAPDRNQEQSAMRSIDDRNPLRRTPSPSGGDERDTSAGAGKGGTGEVPARNSAAGDAREGDARLPRADALFLRRPASTDEAAAGGAQKLPSPESLFRGRNTSPPAAPAADASRTTVSPDQAPPPAPGTATPRAPESLVRGPEASPPPVAPAADASRAALSPDQAPPPAPETASPRAPESPVRGPEASPPPAPPTADTSRAALSPDQAPPPAPETASPRAPESPVRGPDAPPPTAPASDASRIGLTPDHAPLPPETTAPRAEQTLVGGRDAAPPPASPATDAPRTGLIRDQAPPPPDAPGTAAPPSRDRLASPPTTAASDARSILDRTPPPAPETAAPRGLETLVRGSDSSPPPAAAAPDEPDTLQTQRAGARRPEFSSETGRAEGSGPSEAAPAAPQARIRPEAEPERRQTDDRDTTEPMATADMILGSLERQAPRAQEPQAVAPTPRAESTLSEMIQQVAERILVGESGPGGQQEVRILLKDDVLGGTEIRMHEEGGALHLTFVAATKDVENFLGDRQQQIANALGERLDREIRVGVTDRDGAMSQQVEQRNTSDQPNDGRSRNRRFVQDERED